MLPRREATRYFALTSHFSILDSRFLSEVQTLHMDVVGTVFGAFWAGAGEPGF